MKTIIQQLIAAFTGNSLMHGLIMVVLGAVATPLMAWAQSLQDGSAFVLPSWQHILGTAVGAGILYLIKNLIAGSSNPVTPKV